MADAAVDFLLENLQQLLLYHVHLIKDDAKNQVEQLEKDVRLFKTFLQKRCRKDDNSDDVRELVVQIRDVVYEAEDVIDAFITEASESTKPKKNFLRALKKPPVTLFTIVKDVEAVRTKVRDIYNDNARIDDFATLTDGDGDGGGSQEIEVPIVRQENVMDFEDEAETIIGYINEETPQLDVISIIGMPGFGKTAVAKKIFRDPTIKSKFPTRIWIYISQEFTKKDIFLAIIRELTRITDDMYHKNDQDLACLVTSYLERRKFLIVMDDVRTVEDWDKLQIALPKSNNDSKVLITSCNVEVAHFANPDRCPHRLRFLTQDEFWLPLQLEVFGKPVCPYDLEVYGKLIVEQCRCLPLAIVVIGGSILVKKFSASDEMSAKRNAWKKLSENVSAYLSDKDPERRMEKIIALSYDKLPYHLRACFLYFGIFPEDFEIPVWNLIRMWIAEGFIQQKVGSTLEETAESYLDDLMNRNLVWVDKKKSNGRPKTCRIHDMLREFCKTQGGYDRENFLQEIKLSREGGFEPPVSEVQKYRRLCIHSNVLNFITSKPHGPRVRSFASFSKKEIILKPQCISDIPAAFKLLRVLEAKPMTFSRLPSNMYQLVHLRYLTLSVDDLDILPSHFSKFWNLQTLVVKTAPSRTIDIKADIWTMIQLRHLKTSASATLPKVGKSGKEGDKLQTLGTISPQSCTEEVFNQARNLKRLGIRGRLALLLEENSGTFDTFVKLSSLEKLKLRNDVFPAAPLEGKLQGLPQNFPPNLKSLTLSETYLDWNQMYILGSLDNLEVLKLKEKAFMGKRWEVIDEGFRRLEVLHIATTNLAVWVASQHHFPRLRRLELKNCGDLQEIPIGLAYITSLQQLSVFFSKSAATSAKKIRDVVETRQKEEDQTANVCKFKLTINPKDK